MTPAKKAPAKKTARTRKPKIINVVTQPDKPDKVDIAQLVLELSPDELRELKFRISERLNRPRHGFIQDSFSFPVFGGKYRYHYNALNNKLLSLHDGTWKDSSYQILIDFCSRADSGGKKIIIFNVLDYMIQLLTAIRAHMKPAQETHYASPK
jgi:hypothetical protein